MKITLTNLEADRMLACLQRLDKDDKVKLSGQTTMDIAINVNALLPTMQGFQRAQQRAQLSINPDGKREENIKIVDESNALSDQTNEYVLKRIDWSDLKAGDNKIVDVGALAKILKGFGEAEAND